MKFFSSILKHKKIITFVFFFLIVIILAIPQITLAAWYKPWTWGDSLLDAILNGGIALAFSIPILITTGAAALSKTILTSIVDFALIASYTHNTAVNIGWPIVRNLANMFIVLGFVVIGIATTLRIKEYEAKQTLAKLIIAALLINFSLLITGIFIDGSNIVMKFFFDNTSPTSSWIPNVAIGDLISNIGEHSSGEFISILLGIMFFNFIGFFVFVLYAFLILVRLIAIWILVILSPLAFVCYVFPATKNIWQTWWKNFFQWCIIIIPAGLFYYIGWEIINTAASSRNVVNLGTDITLAEFLSNSVSIILAPGLFLIVGFLVSLQFSAMGAGALLNAVNKNKGKIVGGGFNALAKASKVAGGYAGKAGDYLSGNKIGKWSGLAFATKMAGKGATFVGNSAERAQKTKSWTGRTLEGVGALPVGTQAGKDDKGLADAIKALTAALKSGNKKDEQRVLSKITSGTGTDRTAAILAAVSEGKLHEAFKDPNTGAVNHHAMNDAISAAEKSGAPINTRKDAENKYYQLAELNDKNVDAALTAMGHKVAVDTQLTADGIDPLKATPAQRVGAATTAGLPVDDARKRARETHLLEILPKMSGSELRNIDYNDLFYNDDMIKEFTPQIVKQFKTATPDKITAIKDHIGVPGAAGYLADDLARAIADNNKAETTRLTKLIDAINKL